MKVFVNMLLFFVAAIIIVSCLKGAHAEMATIAENLPRTLGAWTRSDSAEIIDESNIFDYMNGAGELYLAYRFDHLEVYEYTAEQQDDILVEVYVMHTSDDAFGLLSLDWDGEPVTLFPSDAAQTGDTVVLPARALYGEGLLRLWADRIYARVLAYRETPESREAVLALGQAIAANRLTPAVPELLQVLPQTISTGWELRHDRIGYFRSYLVLNSLYYLSHQNILNLDHSTEAVTAPYENAADSSSRFQVVFVKYAGAEQARQALEQFHTAYLPEHPKAFETDVTEQHAQAFRIEDGWVAYVLNQNYLAIVFEAPDQESAAIITEYFMQHR